MHTQGMIQTLKSTLNTDCNQILLHGQILKTSEVMAVYTYDKDTPKIRIYNEKCHNNIDIISKIMKYYKNFQNICV